EPAAAVGRHIQNAELTLQLLRENAQHSRLFTCGLSPTANRHMLRALAQAGGGAYEFFDTKTKHNWTEKVACQVKRIASPGCSSVSVKWQQFNPTAPTPVQAPRQLHALFNDCHTLVYGFVPHCTQATLLGNLSGQELKTMVSTSELQKTRGTFLHKLTARALIRDYEDGSLDANEAEHEGKKAELKSFIIELSKEFSILSQFTSFVAIEERDSEQPDEGFTDIPKLIAEEDVDFLPYISWNLPQDSEEEEEDMDMGFYLADIETNAMQDYTFCVGSSLDMAMDLSVNSASMDPDSPQYSPTSPSYSSDASPVPYAAAALPDFGHSHAELKAFSRMSRVKRNEFEREAEYPDANRGYSQTPPPPPPPPALCRPPILNCSLEVPIQASPPPPPPPIPPTLSAVHRFQSSVFSSHSSGLPETLTSSSPLVPKRGVSHYVRPVLTQSMETQDFRTHALSGASSLPFSFEGPMPLDSIPSVARCQMMAMPTKSLDIADVDVCMSYPGGPAPAPNALLECPIESGSPLIKETSSVSETTAHTPRYFSFRGFGARSASFGSAPQPGRIGSMVQAELSHPPIMLDDPGIARSSRIKLRRKIILSSSAQHSFQERKSTDPEALELKWTKIFQMQHSKGYWELTTELGELINVNADLFANVFLKNKGIHSLGVRAHADILRLVATLLVLQLMRVEKLEEGKLLRTLFCLDNSSQPRPKRWEEVKRAVDWVCWADRQYPCVYSRLEFGLSWESSTRQLLGYEGLPPFSPLSGLNLQRTTAPVLVH
ncbi:protein mono-ADP-ribosyltransferase PARP4, partial [Lates calcarifer]|uniref:Protein mono-ADP-ribosyltransferase PARP4 n=1 Tax=Lates calcarifer TaxID=8187 RepID=A0AAJ8B4Z8_LATCA